MDTLGLVLLELGDWKKAVPLLQRAANRSPENLDILSHLARALSEKGDDGKAREILQKILSNEAQFAERGNAERLMRELEN